MKANLRTTSLDSGGIDKALRRVLPGQTLLRALSRRLPAPSGTYLRTNVAEALQFFTVTRIKQLGDSRRTHASRSHHARKSECRSVRSAEQSRGYATTRSVTVRQTHGSVSFIAVQTTGVYIKVPLCAIEDPGTPVLKFRSDEPSDEEERIHRHKC